jgi:hypothetical protein
MISGSDIEDAVENVVQTNSPLEIVVEGSMAFGTRDWNQLHTKKEADAERLWPQAGRSIVEYLIAPSPRQAEFHAIQERPVPYYQCEAGNMAILSVSLSMNFSPLPRAVPWLNGCLLARRHLGVTGKFHDMRVECQNDGYNTLDHEVLIREYLQAIT